MRSPGLSEARAAGLSGATFAISAPDGRLSPILSAMSAVTACNLAPSHGRATALPPVLADPLTHFTMLGGQAETTPCEPPEREKMAVLMPTSLPVMSTNAPPELPGLI